MPKTSGNVPTLVLIGPLSNLFVTAIIIWFLHPKNNITPTYIYIVSKSSDNPRRLWQTINKLLHRKSSSPLPTSTSASALADSLASFFTDKISKLRLSLANSSTSASPHSPTSQITPPDFSAFKPASESEISKILFNCPNKQSDSDHLIPTWLLKKCSALLVPTVTNIVNLSLSSIFITLLKNLSYHLFSRNLP